MDEHSTKADGRMAADGTGLFTGAAWFDPIEAGLRERVRGFICELLDEELTAALGGRAKHERAAAAEPRRTAEAAVIGSRPARPRTPSVPKRGGFTPGESNG